MLKGRDGYQIKEFDRLTSWLNKNENRPDVVYLSNVLLAGLAKPIKQALGIPIVCLLNDEDKFLDELTPPYNQQGWTILTECVDKIDAFIAGDKHYADVMKERLQIEQDKMHVVCEAEKIASIFTMILKNFTEDDHA